MASTTERGYGWTHQKLRALALANYSPADPCWRCTYPLGPYPELLDLGHVDGDKTRYAGLEHRRCSRSAGARYSNQLRGRNGSAARRRRWGPPVPAPRPRSREW